MAENNNTNLSDDTLISFLYGELSTDEMARVDSIIASDPRMQSHLGKLQLARAAYDSANTPAAPPLAASAILARAADEQAQAA